VAAWLDWADVWVLEGWFEEADVVGAAEEVALDPVGKTLLSTLPNKPPLLVEGLGDAEAEAWSEVVWPDAEFVGVVPAPAEELGVD